MKTHSNDYRYGHIIMGEGAIQPLSARDDTEADVCPCPDCIDERCADANLHEALTSDQTTKASNPKDAAAMDKLPLHLVPAALKAYCALALAEGFLKYGAWNWRASGVRASVYRSALDRHLDKWWNGEECDPLTGVPHLANATACLAVLIDARVSGTLTDDRPPSQPNLSRLIDSDSPAFLKTLKSVFGSLTPRHFTIADSAIAKDQKAT